MGDAENAGTIIARVEHSTSPTSVPVRFFAALAGKPLKIPFAFNPHQSYVGIASPHSNHHFPILLVLVEIQTNVNFQMH
jgi:hypothetical protein